MKLKLKEKAIKLRIDGLSYSEILAEVPVAKSTLSLWLRSIGLSKRQKQKITEKKIQAARLGGLKRKNQRIEATKNIRKKAFNEIKAIDRRTLWLMGIMLYWAEGSKEKQYRPGQRVLFSNSDPFMIRIFLKWLLVCLKISRSKIGFQIYVHEAEKERLEEVRSYWSRATGFPLFKFGKIYFKKHSLKSNRRVREKDYFGLVRVVVFKSTNLNRKIAGWIEGICYQCGVV